jgi:hypothetical protein
MFIFQVLNVRESHPITKKKKKVIIDHKYCDQQVPFDKTSFIKMFLYKYFTRKNRLRLKEFFF